MRFGHALFVATTAALLAAAAPGLAKNGEAPKPCHSYQMGADGSWIELPCQELGAPATSPKSSSRKADEDR